MSLGLSGTIGIKGHAGAEASTVGGPCTLVCTCTLHSQGLSILPCFIDHSSTPTIPFIRNMRQQ